jgi:hypothetical protein
MLTRVLAGCVLFWALGALPGQGSSGRRVYDSPPGFPSEAEVLRALPPAPGKVRTNVRIVWAARRQWVEPPRLYPLVGRARLSCVRFKCTVHSSAGAEVVYIDRDRLVPVK